MMLNENEIHGWLVKLYIKNLRLMNKWLYLSNNNHLSFVLFSNIQISSIVTQIIQRSKL